MKRTILVAALVVGFSVGSIAVTAGPRQHAGFMSEDCIVLSFREIKQDDGSHKQIEIRQCGDAVGVCTRIRRGGSVTPWSCRDII